MAKEKREGFRSRLGFILVSAGCAIGIGNVWEFQVCASVADNRYYCQRTDRIDNISKCVEIIICE